MRVTYFFRFFLIVVLLPVISTAASAPVFAASQNQNTVSLQGLPQNYADFKARCQFACLTPEGAVKMYFDAVFCYLDPDRRSEASKMLRYIMHAESNWEGSQKYVTFIRRLEDPAYHYIFKSFAVGTSPENGYEMSPDTYSLVFTRKDKQQDYIRVFLRSSGADSDRRVWVKQYSDGFWYVINNSDTYAKVRDPECSGMDNSHDADYDTVSPAQLTMPAENMLPQEMQPTENIINEEIQPAEDTAFSQTQPEENAESVSDGGSEVSTW